MENRNTYVVATIRPWNLEVYEKVLSVLPGDWHLISDSGDLTAEAVARLAPRFVFFPHWSWKIPPEIFHNHECIGFHETDLPYGRGGSPLQNLIARGHRETVICAFRITEEMDAGDVYLREPLSLQGAAEEIFLRAARTVGEMIARIVETEPVPVSQTGDAVVFKRRKPAQSEITEDIADLDQLYDHIRMLDAAEYPRAFLRVGPFVVRFSHAQRRTDRIEAAVTITTGDEE